MDLLESIRLIIPPSRKQPEAWEERGQLGWIWGLALSGAHWVALQRALPPWLGSPACGSREVALRHSSQPCLCLAQKLPSWLPPGCLQPSPRFMWVCPALGAWKPLTGALLLPKRHWASPPEPGGQRKPPNRGLPSWPAPLQEFQETWSPPASHLNDLRVAHSSPSPPAGLGEPGMSASPLHPLHSKVGAFAV